MGSSTVPRHQKTYIYIYIYLFRRCDSDWRSPKNRQKKHRTVGRHDWMSRVYDVFCSTDLLANGKEQTCENQLLQHVKITYYIYLNKLTNQKKLNILQLSKTNQQLIFHEHMEWWKYYTYHKLDSCAMNVISPKFVSGAVCLLKVCLWNGYMKISYLPSTVSFLCVCWISGWVLMSSKQTVSLDVFEVQITTITIRVDSSEVDAGNEPKVPSWLELMEPSRCIDLYIDKSVR